eukprot:4975415-Ditylum_brightwellii.AAC.1
MLKEELVNKLQLVVKAKVDKYRRCESVGRGKVDVINIDEGGIESAQLLSTLDCVTRYIRKNSDCMGGIL